MVKSIIVVVATDGRRLSFIENSVSEQKSSKGIIIPSKTVQELIKLFAESDSGEKVNMQILDNQVAFRFNGTGTILRILFALPDNCGMGVPIIPILPPPESHLIYLGKNGNNLNPSSRELIWL